MKAKNLQYGWLMLRLSELYIDVNTSVLFVCFYNCLLYLNLLYNESQVKYFSLQVIQFGFLLYTESHSFYYKTLAVLSQTHGYTLLSKQYTNLQLCCAICMQKLPIKRSVIADDVASWLSICLECKGPFSQSPALYWENASKRLGFRKWCLLCVESNTVISSLHVWQ